MIINSGFVSNDVSLSVIVGMVILVVWSTASYTLCSGRSVHIIISLNLSEVPPNLILYVFWRFLYLIWEFNSRSFLFIRAESTLSSSRYFSLYMMKVWMWLWLFLGIKSENKFYSEWLNCVRLARVVTFLSAVICLFALWFDSCSSMIEPLMLSTNVVFFRRELIDEGIGSLLCDFARSSLISVWTKWDYLILSMTFLCFEVLFSSSLIRVLVALHTDRCLSSTFFNSACSLRTDFDFFMFPVLFK